MYSIRGKRYPTELIEGAELTAFCCTRHHLYLSFPCPSDYRAIYQCPSVEGLPAKQRTQVLDCVVFCFIVVTSHRSFGPYRRQECLCAAPWSVFYTRYSALVYCVRERQMRAVLTLLLTCRGCDGRYCGETEQNGAQEINRTMHSQPCCGAKCSRSDLRYRSSSSAAPQSEPTPRRCLEPCTIARDSVFNRRLLFTLRTMRSNSSPPVQSSMTMYRQLWESKTWFNFTMLG